MIQFSKLRIQGFKSFVDPTDLSIDPGLTGIVGPNGCGKSNLVEALRWAMGETSAKRLRGGGMNDVIFAGTEKRPARNLAEVQISLDNAARTATASFNSFDELVVSRKIDRDKGSTYRVNGQEVRARDVQLLFTDSASGASSTSLVGQGKINAIITAKPQDRRVLLEEAAGIGGLRTRRHEASLRLKSAESNLERLDGHVSDLGARRRELLRQSRQAEKYKTLSEQIRVLELQISALDWIQVALDLDLNLRELDEAKVLAANTELDLGKANGAFGENEESLAPLRRAETEAAAVLTHARVTREQAAASQVRNQAQQDAVRQALAQLIADLERETAILEQADKTLASLEDEKSALQEASVKRSAELADAEEKSKAASQNVRERDEALQALKQERVALTSQRDGLQTQLTKAKTELSQRDREIQSWQSEFERLQASLAANQELRSLEQAVETASQAFELADKALIALEPELEAAQEAELELKAIETDARNALQTLRSEVSALERALQAAAKSGSTKSLAVDVKAPAELATAVSAVLSTASPFGALSDSDQGWADLGPLALSAPNGFAPLTDKLGLPSALNRRFAGVGLADSKEAALAAQATLGPGQALVTQDGWMIAWDGLVLSPGAADATLARRIEQQQRFDALSPELAPAEEALNQASQATQAARASKDSLSKNLNAARVERQQAQQRVGKAEQALNRSKQTVEVQTKRLTSLEAQLEQGGLEQKRVREQIADLDTQIAELPDTFGIDDHIVEAERKLTEARQQSGRARGQVDELKNLSTRQQERLSAIDREQNLWLERASAASELKDSFAAREARQNQERDQLEESLSQLAEDLESLKQKELDAGENHKAVAAKLKDAEAETDSLKRALKEAEKEAQEAQHSLIRAETLLEASRERRQELRARIQETHNKTPDGVIADCGLDVNDLAALPNRDELASTLETAKNQRAALGAVNLMASEEAENLESEAATIEAEKAEIEEAISKLRKTISTINKEARARVLEAFETINKRFGELFTELFGGGKAKLELIDSDDPLEAGLELFAQPPGKKLQSLSLLSGGEQTMSAIALLFSVFLANPAPICVLDEVDAPLDEANVARFIKIVRRLAQMCGTRFLVVTHHPVTMARVDRLFGVTMQEQGISTLVTLDLNQAAELAQVG